MFLLDILTKKLAIPSAGEALAGRQDPLPTAERHFVTGRPLKGPFPEGLKQVVLGLGCFWGAERILCRRPACGSPPSAMPAARRRTRPTRRRATGMTGHTEAVLVVYDPAVISLEALLKVFFEAHDPTQGMRQGNDVGTQYRSAIYLADPAELEVARRVKSEYQAALLKAGHGNHHHRDRRRRPVLLRRGLSPAVPGEEPERLLRHRRHRRVLPDRPSRRRPARPLTRPPSGGQPCRSPSRSSGMSPRRCASSPRRHRLGARNAARGRRPPRQAHPQGASPPEAGPHRAAGELRPLAGEAARRLGRELGDIARSLSAARDADVMAGTAERLSPASRRRGGRGAPPSRRHARRPRQGRPRRTAADRRRRRGAGAGGGGRRRPRMGQEGGRADVLLAGIETTYRDGRAAARRRRRAGCRRRAAARLAQGREAPLAPVEARRVRAPAAAAPSIVTALDELGEMLARTTTPPFSPKPSPAEPALAGGEAEAGRVVAVVAARRAALQADAFARGRVLYEDKPSKFRKAPGRAGGPRTTATPRSPTAA